MERIANEQLSFSLSADGRQFEPGCADEAPTLSGERELFDMMAALRNRWPELLMTGKGSHFVMKGGQGGLSANTATG